MNFILALEEMMMMKNKDDKVSRSVFEQVQWERDMALSQLKDLGYGIRICRFYL